MSARNFGYQAHLENKELEIQRAGRSDHFRLWWVRHLQTDIWPLNTSQARSWPSVSLPMAAGRCAGWRRRRACGGSDARRAGQASAAALKAKTDPGDVPHFLFNRRAMGLDGSGGEGQCRVCSHKHTSGIGKTCPTRLDTDRVKPFCAGSHGSQCFRRHLHAQPRHELSNQNYTATPSKFRVRLIEDPWVADN